MQQLWSLYSEGALYGNMQKVCEKNLPLHIHIHKCVFIHVYPDVDTHNKVLTTTSRVLT